MLDDRADHTTERHSGYTSRPEPAESYRDGFRRHALHSGVRSSTALTPEGV